MFDKAIVRRIKLFAFLASSHRPRTRREIAEHFDISEKTAGRDCLDLIAAGFGVVETHDRAGRALYHVDRAHGLPPGLTCPTCAAGGRS